MGKYNEKAKWMTFQMPFAVIVLSFFLVEWFAFGHLQSWDGGFHKNLLWPLIFGGLWSAGLGCAIRLFPWRAARGLYGVLFAASLIYGAVQTGYYHLFQEMLWLSDFLYASEGADYLDVLLSYPVSWYLWIVALAALGVMTVWKFPRWVSRSPGSVFAVFALVCCGMIAHFLPSVVFRQDADVRYSATDYGRAKSAEAAYENMFNTHRLYQVCGLYQTAAKDIYANAIYPLTPGYRTAWRQNWNALQNYFATDQDGSGANAMTGILKDKNVILVLMESMDDWMIGSFTPNLYRLMEEGICFSNFYTPPYGGIRTFNTEFCINTGSFLSSQGGYAFDYVTNHYRQSLANQLKQHGYDGRMFHYNDPSFYSRDVFSKALGYEAYVCYADYLDGVEAATAKQLLYDDCLLFDIPQLKAEFFREGKKLNFVITRSAHLSYKYNEVLSHWGLKQYPGFRGLTGSEETDCALLKARLVDDFFARLLAELEACGQLESTVIVGVTDHYTYGYKDTEQLLVLSGVEEPLLLEKTPCFIWYKGCEPLDVEKPLNTSDFLPTLLNMLGVEPEQDYIGRDAFDGDYPGFVPFSDGSWITNAAAYDVSSHSIISSGEADVSAEYQSWMVQKVQQFININNLILETDYYR